MRNHGRGHSVIYSKSRDFLFVKGRKVAGTSVEIALSSVCGPEDILTPMTPIDELERIRLYGTGARNYSASPEIERKYLAWLSAANRKAIARVDKPDERYIAHMSLKKFVGEYGTLPTKRVFCVERNPYAKIISWANMTGPNFRAYKQHGRQMTMEVDQLRQVIANRLAEPEMLSCRNIALYRYRKGRMPVRVLRFESLATDFEQLMMEYGITPAPPLPHAKKGIGSNSIDPHSIFTREQLDKVNEMFKAEFEEFGYEML